MTPNTDFDRGPALPIAATILWGLLLLPALGAAMMSPMMFDAPGSEQDMSLRLLFDCVLAFPLFCILSIVGSWVAWSTTRAMHGTKTALTLAAWALLPLLPVGFAGVIALFHAR